MKNDLINMFYKDWDNVRFGLINTIRDRRDLDLALYAIDKDYASRLNTLRDSLKWTTI
ncbi:MAG: hypothetical protein ACI9GH_000129 [Candidatus Paceibacteria bacterium]|jgi:hypothetical protein